MRLGLAVITLLALVACEPPQARMSAHKAYAIEVVFHEDLPGLSDPERADLHAVYNAAIRAQLAAEFGNPIAVPSEDCPVVKVEVDAIRVAAYPPSGGLFKDWMVDSTVGGVLDNLLHDSNADGRQTARNNSYLDQYIDRKVETHRLDRLGYLPLLVAGKLIYADGDRTYACALEGEDMLTTFRPLNELGGKDPHDIRMEEGRVLAQVVANRLASKSGWVVKINR